MPNAIKKPLHEIAMLLTMRPDPKADPKVVQAVLFRVECTMWIAEAIKE
jgi:hypothetical protein